MRCAVLGKNGQLGMALAEKAWPKGWQLDLLDRRECDLSDLDNIHSKLEARNPNIIINAAAYTAVDKAENEPELADRINHRAVGILGSFAAKKNIPIIHFSTDYVFDGSMTRPYKEEDIPAPINIYGKSKLAGELALRTSGSAFTILRTSWVYYEKGINFVLKMLSLADRKELSIVEDQYGAPTYAGDLAQATRLVAEKVIAGNRGRDLFHLSAAGDTNWYGFAQKIFSEAATYGLPIPGLNPIPSVAYPTPAPRPRNSRLDCGEIARTYNIVLPNWEDSLRKCVHKIYGGK